MDGLGKDDFLAGFGDELESSRATPTGPPPNPRRLSAAGRAIASKRKSREEVGNTLQKLKPIVPPPDSTPDLGQSFLTNPPPDPLQTPALSTKSNQVDAEDTGNAAPDIEDVDITIIDEKETSSADSPKINRSGKKRRLAPDAADKRNKKKMAANKTPDEDPFAKLAKMIKGLENKIDQSEVRMSTKIDGSMEDLAAKLETRIARTETAVSHVQKEITEIRTVASEENIQRLVSIAMAKPQAEASRDEGRRPRFYRRETRIDSDDDGPFAASTPYRPSRREDDRARPTSHEENYLLARRQLRLWPILQEGGLEVGVHDFLKNKLLISDARINHIKFTARPIDSRPGSNAQDQVLVTFDSLRSRDEVQVVKSQRH